MTSYGHLLALGSSFAAGPGIEPLSHAPAGRSTRNYPSILAELSGARLTDRTASGATTDNVLDTAQRARTTTLPPQLSDFPSDVDLITVTVGGNDVQYLATLIRLMVAGRLRKNPLTRVVAGAVSGDLTGGPTPAVGIRVAESLVRVVSRARELAPGARVVLVDYLTIVGPDTRHSDEVPLTASEIAAIKDFGDAISAGFSSAAASAGTDLVAMSEVGRAHGLGSPQPWVTGMNKRLTDVLRRPPCHPNAEGMAATARTVAAMLNR
ncbi:lysophospholipase L1-like esterase [Rhodococcus sp. 27YEA15]|uniref:SGNH/GDSL hydrolase family protein n=1 Tax=Rhodococcus sp. 27YEA15 TaxID=3156259 RepID=UPI003C7B8743